MTYFHHSLPPSRVRRLKRPQSRSRNLPQPARGPCARTARPARKPARRFWEQFMKTRLAPLKGGAKRAGLFLRHYAPLFWFSLLLAVFGFMLANRS